MTEVSAEISFAYCCLLILFNSIWKKFTKCIWIAGQSSWHYFFISVLQGELAETHSMNEMAGMGNQLPSAASTDLPQTI